MNKIKISLIALGLFVAAIGCNKPQPAIVSTVVRTSAPTITLQGSQFYSIPIGGTIPVVAATAYDSILMESYPVSLDASGVDVSTPGLYVVPITTKNKNGYKSSINVMIGVSDIPDAWDLSGAYARTANGAIVNLTEVANGIYMVDNVGGAPTLPVIGYFLQIDDATIDFPLQGTDNVGDIDCLNEQLTIAAPDTSYSWIVDNAFFGTANRIFVKQ